MRSVTRRMRWRISSKMIRPAAIMVNITMRLVGVRRTNSKKSRISGMTKAAAMMPMIVRRRPARSLLSGREIQ